MLKVKVFSGDVLIGTAELFAADPPMGVARGVLVPTQAYAPLRSTINAIFMGPTLGWSELALKAVAEDGSVVSGVGGAYIDDVLEDDFPPQLTVAGIDCASGLYEAWFGKDLAYRDYYLK
jgi:hypothetical protein